MYLKTQSLTAMVIIVAKNTKHDPESQRENEEWMIGYSSKLLFLIIRKMVIALKHGQEK